MKITITDVAEKARVSIKTVSRVLNHEPNVAKTTRDRVMAAATELRYTPNLAARGLASSKSYLIALLYDNPSPNYITQLQQGATDACRAKGYHLVVEPLDFQNADNEVEIAALLTRLPVDGVILTPPLCDNQQILDVLDSLAVPYVPVAPVSNHKEVSTVKMDDVLAAKEMTEYLISLGHKHIGFIKGHVDHSAAHLRYKGFEIALKSAGLTLDQHFVTQGDFSFKSGVKAAEYLIGQNVRPTAIFASNDDMAAGVVFVANGKGIAVPKDLSVVGCDNTPLASILWPQLTTIEQPIRAMGFKAAEILLNPSDKENHTGDYCLDHKLVLRESTSSI